MTSAPATLLSPLPLPEFRLGALVPPANPAVEIEYPALTPASAALHVMRLPVHPGSLEDRNRAYVASYEPSLRGFGNLKLDAISVAMTAPQYRLMHQGDQDLCRRLSDLAGVPVETSSMALFNALRALGVEHLSLISPYPDSITQLACDYWKSAGFHVHSVTSFKDELVAYKVSTDQVVAALGRTDVHPDGAIVLSGTGMRTLEAISEASATVRVPMLSSNLCSVWSLTKDISDQPSLWMRHSLPGRLVSSTWPKA